MQMITHFGLVNLLLTTLSIGIVPSGTLSVGEEMPSPRVVTSLTQAENSAPVVNEYEDKSSTEGDTDRGPAIDIDG